MRRALACACLSALLLMPAAGCRESRGTEFGQNFMNVASEGRVDISEYRFVADSKRHLYWPNTRANRERIPKADRVYILDFETMQKFHGFKPGR